MHACKQSSTSQPCSGPHSPAPPPLSGSPSSPATLRLRHPRRRPHPSRSATSVNHTLRGDTACSTRTDPECDSASLLPPLSPFAVSPRTVTAAAGPPIAYLRIRPRQPIRTHTHHLHRSRHRGSRSPRQSRSRPSSTSRSSRRRTGRSSRSTKRRPPTTSPLARTARVNPSRPTAARPSWASPPPSPSPV